MGRIHAILDAPAEIARRGTPLPVAGIRGDVALRGLTLRLRRRAAVLHDVDLEVPAGQHGGDRGTDRLGQDRRSSACCRGSRRAARARSSSTARRAADPARDAARRHRLRAAGELPLLRHASRENVALRPAPATTRPRGAARPRTSRSSRGCARTSPRASTPRSASAASRSRAARSSARLSRARWRSTAHPGSRRRALRGGHGDRGARSSRACARCCGSRTTFLVSHRVSTVKDADLILVLRRGTHRRARAPTTSCVAQGGFYAELHRRQLLEEEVETARTPRDGSRRGRGRRARATTGCSCGGCSATCARTWRPSRSSFAADPRSWPGLDLVGPYLTKVAIDRYIAQRRRARAWRASRVLYLARARGGVRSCATPRTYVLQMTGQRVMQDMRRQIFGHLQRLHVGYFDRNPVGRLMTRVTTDVDAVNELFTSGVVTVFGDLFTLLGHHGGDARARLAARARDVRRDPALLRCSRNWFRKGARQTFRETRALVARINAFLQENLSGMAVVQLFRREERKPRGVRRDQPRPRRRQHARRSSTTRSSTRRSSCWPPWPSR